jgi:hypothetical protein
MSTDLQSTLSHSKGKKRKKDVGNFSEGTGKIKGAKPIPEPKNEAKKKKKKMKRKKKTLDKIDQTSNCQTCGDVSNSDANANTDAVDDLITSLSTGGAGTLSDRLNHDHPYYDADLKSRWKSFSKKQRLAVIKADSAALDKARQVGQANAAALPFETESDDHCESPPEAYADIASSVLDLIAAKLGKTRKNLLIYDPYFCAGSMKRHLGALGFENVHNERVDFYDVLARDALPLHDVVVTNPPYSQDHIERLLKFAGGHDKPYLLLMPNFVCAKPYFVPLLTATSQRKCEVKSFRSHPPVFVCPHKRYCYWTPKAMRLKGKLQGHSNATLGHRTSPFASFWYVDTEPLIARDSFLRHAASLPPTLPDSSGYPGELSTMKPRLLPLFCQEVSHLPSAVRP